MLARTGVQVLGVRATPHVLFLQLGRSELGRFTLDLARNVAGMRHVRATFCVARQHASFGELAGLDCDVLPAEIGEGPGGGPLQAQRAATLYHNLGGELTRQRSTGMVSLMPPAWPHVWRPLPRRLASDHAVRHLTVVHDAGPYLRDAKGLLTDETPCGARRVEPVIALGGPVADMLAAAGAVARDRLITLFHPDLAFGGGPAAPAPGAGARFRVLTLDRVVDQRGLEVLIEAVALLRGQGVSIGLGVFGSGPLGPLRARLAELGAEVQTRALADHEVPALLSRHHAVAVLPGGTSQGTIAAIALGAGLPLIGWRAGWLAEQVLDGATGVIADAGSPASLAAAIRRLAVDARLYAGITAHIRRSAWQRSMRRFAEHLVALAIDALPLPGGLSGRDLTWV